MPKIKVLSGKEVLKIFEHFGFVVTTQKGSHIKLKRTTATGLKQSLTIPLHNELDKGTLKAIYRQALRYVSETDLTPHFYAD